MEIGQLFKDMGNVILYAVLALAGCLLAIGAVIYGVKRERFGSFVKYAAGVAIGFAVAVIIVMSYLKAVSVEVEDGGMSDMLFWPIMAALIVAVAGAIAMLVCGMFGKKAVRIAGICAAALELGVFIAAMVVMSKYSGTVMEYYPEASPVGMIVSAVVFMAIIVGIYLIGDKRSISDTRSVVYGAIAIALSFALSYVRFFKMPQGGSVTFASLLPLLFYCCMFGTRRGVIVCLIYGVLQAIQDPWIIHPMQFLLDYPLAFGVIGISGIFVEKNVFKFKGGTIVGFLLGGVLAVCLRYACHVLSGVYAFASTETIAEYGYKTFAGYSMAYNSFAFIDMLIALAAGTAMLASRSFVAQMTKSSDVAARPAEEGEEIDDNDEIDALLAARASKNAADEQGSDEASDVPAEGFVDADIVTSEQGGEDAGEQD